AARSGRVGGRRSATTTSCGGATRSWLRPKSVGEQRFSLDNDRRYRHEANLAYGSIYQYFDSKDDLFDALMSAEAYALRTHVAVALAATGQRADRSWEPLRAAVQATFEFFEKDKATAKLLLRDAYALGERFETHLNNIYEEFIDDVDEYMSVAQQRGKAISAPPRMVAYSVAAPIGQLAHRRLITDDGVTAADVAEFGVEFVRHGLRAR